MYFLTHRRYPIRETTANRVPAVDVLCCKNMDFDGLTVSARIENDPHLNSIAKPLGQEGSEAEIKRKLVILCQIDVETGHMRFHQRDINRR
jgi:hypothetical protein